MVLVKRGLIFVVLILFFVVLSSSVLAEPGCYTYPGDEDLYCQQIERVEAQTDCDGYTDCNLDERFIPNDDCSALTECQEIRCDVDCQSHARGWCAQLGLNEQGPAGSEVPDESYNAQCTAGCCRIEGSSFCQGVPNEWTCRLQAQVSGRSLAQMVFVPGQGSTAQCSNGPLCQAVVDPASLSGRVLNLANTAIAGATLVLEGRNLQTTSSTDGSYSFSSLTPGIYQILVTATGYNPLRVTISLVPSQIATQEFTLQPVTAMATISGTVRATFTDGIVNVLPGATVSWGSGRQVLTDVNGNYQITNLAPGTYTLRASKVGFTSVSSPAQTVLAGAALNNVNINIQELPFQGVRGVTFIDENGNGRQDGTEAVEYSVRVFVDGVFRETSHYPNGDFAISLSPGEHQVYATYFEVISGRTFETQTPVEIMIAAGTMTRQDLALIPLQSDCLTLADYNVEEFTLSPVPGQEQVRLHWVKPCSAVQGYQITKREGSQSFPLIGPLSLTQHSFTDYDVEWGKTYTYEIVALNERGETSSQPNIQQITLGNGECADRYIDSPGFNGWEQFCLVDQRQTVYTCTDDNILSPIEECSPNSFCARTSSTTAGCKDAGVCSVGSANPFGLYATADVCYGTPGELTPQDGEAVNFCYFDSSKTIINQCNSCLDIQTCFDYKSKDACEVVNNCLTTVCKWVDSAQYDSSNPLIDYSGIGLSIPTLITEETGTGYCTEQDYGKGETMEFDDQCARCSSGGELYENYYCTADVCSNLGRCFSNPPSLAPALTSCVSCGDVGSCYNYETELECTGGEAIANANGRISLSQDSCNWGRCTWVAGLNGRGSCIKNGDANVVDDCATFSGNRLNNCREDNTAPSTVLEPAGLKTISLSSSQITFHASDNHRLGSAWYCLSDVQEADCNDFLEQAYPGRLSDERTIVNITAILQQQVNGRTYKLRYYSKDEFFNQEDVQEQILYVDNIAPEFEIGEEISTVGDQTDLTIFLEGIREPLQCSVTLTPVLPRGTVQTRALGREEEKRTVFSDLSAAIVAVDVTCTDDNGNQRNRQEQFTFDLARDIDIIYPPFRGAVAQTAIAFKVETAIAARCELYDENNQKLADFVADSTGKVHETATLPGFIESEYVGQQQVICYNALTGAVFPNPDYFQFRVDFTPPPTQIVLREGAREVLPLFAEWEEFFVQAVNVNFECHADGFACDKTFYCLGNGCEDITNTAFQEYEGEVIVDHSTRICYYSTDIGNTRVYNPICGDIRVEGFGITLERPSLRYYHDEVWGVSNTPEFTWQFFTRVPTVECKFDFTPNFDYDSQPAYKIRTPDAAGRYTFENFPASVFSTYSSNGGIKVVYVQCKDSQDQIGPEQKMLLEYDSSIPSIQNAYADPDPVVEGISTTLFAMTDDKTLCKYSDNSEGRGSAEFSTMEFFFPGFSDGIMELAHEDIFTVNFLGATKTYNLNLQCENGAGDVSPIRQLSFLVDYSALGNILSLFPDGQSFKVTQVPLQVETSRVALCEYRLNSTYHPFDGAGTRMHTAELRSLQEGSYTLPVRCTMGDHEVQNQLRFTVDLTAPRINSINDGSYSCGADVIVFVDTNESNVTTYFYDLYDKGIGNTSLRNSTNILVLNGSVSGGQSLRIATESLLENHRYTVKVRAEDAAGNAGTTTESDGFIVVSRNNSVCQSTNLTGPRVNVVLNDLSCDSVSVRMDCVDSLSCTKLRYGTNPTSTACNATQDYSTNILLDRTEFLCYYVENAVGRNYTGQQKIVFDDADGDGIKDSCDKCKDTAPGKIVDTIGCADAQVSPDKRDADVDNDGLPDQWEQMFNSLDCKLDYLSDDSNANNIPDNIEDYDGDGSTNYVEYTAETNPCMKDEARPTPITTAPGVTATGGNLVAWILLIVGLLLTLSGIGYLIYYYNKPARNAGVSRPVPITETISTAASNVAESFRKISPFQRNRADRQKQRQREEVFGAFSKKSSEIPHLGELLEKTSTQLPHLQKVAERYAEHKEEIKPGLRSEEKSVFAKLENIAKQAKDKAMDEIVSKEEAEDIFSKLRNIKKKREQ